MSREMEWFRQKDFWKREAVDGLWRIALALVPLMALVLVPSQVIHGQVYSPAAPPASVPPAPVPPAPVPPAPVRSPIVPVGDKRIVGAICDEAGKPVAGINVGLTWHWSLPQDNGMAMTGSEIVGHVLTDAQGRFSFSKLPAGKFDYQVWSQTSENALGLYVTQKASFVISSLDSEKHLSVMVSTGSVVTGRVVDGQTGEPLAGVFVGAGPIPSGGDLTKWTFWAMPTAARTDSQGHYQVRVMPGNVFVSLGRIENNTLLSRRIRDTVQRVSVRPGHMTSAPDLAVFLHPVIVFAGPDGQPVANTPIRITPADMKRGSPTIDDHTDEKGTVVLSYYESGSFSLSQNGLYASGAFQWSPGHPLVIQTGGQTLTFQDGGGKVQLIAGSSAVITGYVVSEDEKPIPNALVKVYESDPKSHYGLGEQLFRTDASGNFHAPLDPSGEYQASVRADGFNQVMVSKKPLSLAKGQPTRLGTIHLVHADGSVSGRIVDRSGKPMPGILAAVQGEKTGMSASLTDAQGRFRIPNVVPSEVLHLTLCLHGELVDGDSGNAGFQSNEQMDSDGVRASPVERQIVWRPHS